MRLLSALFDAALLPVAVAKDAIDLICCPFNPYRATQKSETRKQIERVEDDLS